MTQPIRRTLLATLALPLSAFATLSSEQVTEVGNAARVDAVFIDVPIKMLPSTVAFAGQCVIVSYFGKRAAISYVPAYKGGGPLHTDALGGQIVAAFLHIPNRRGVLFKLLFDACTPLLSGIDDLF